MLFFAFALICAAAAIGAGLAVAHLREAPARPSPFLALVHGAVGGAGLAALVAALRGGLARAGMGLSGFGPISAGLLGIAFAFGLALGLSARRRRPSGALIGAHASLAIAGLVVLLALIALSPGGPPSP
jgi:hypothetical protein